MFYWLDSGQWSREQLCLAKQTEYKMYTAMADDNRSIHSLVADSLCSQGRQCCIGHAVGRYGQ